MSESRMSGRSAWSWTGMAIAGLPVLFALLLLLASQARWDWEGPAPCEKALDFAMAELPEKARDAKCRRRGIMDSEYSGSFRMPRADLDAWVTRSFPDRGERPDSGYETPPCTADVCVDVTRDPRTTKGAHVITVTARHDADGTTLVEFHAFNA